MTCVECKFYFSCEGLQLAKVQDGLKIKKIFELNSKIYPPRPLSPPKECNLKTISEEFGLLMLFIFLLPFFLFIWFGDWTIVKDCGFEIYLLSLKCFLFVMNYISSVQILFYSFEDYFIGHFWEN